MTPCARCGQRPVADPDAGRLGEAAALAVMCAECAAKGPLTPEEAARYRDRLAEDEMPERGFEGVGDFESDDPYERYIAHQAAKGRLR